MAEVIAVNALTDRAQAFLVEAFRKNNGNCDYCGRTGPKALHSPGTWFRHLQTQHPGSKRTIELLDTLEASSESVAAPQRATKAPKTPSVVAQVAQVAPTVAQAWTYTGTRNFEACARTEPHDPHLWSPTLGADVEEDQRTEDIRACPGERDPSFPTGMTEPEATPMPPPPPPGQPQAVQ